MPQPGDVIADKYRVEREIGSGGMGTVFEVTHLVTHRRFAIKWLDPALATNPDATQRFVREAQIAGSFDHPNVVEVYDLGIVNGAYFMLMELLEGESLAARIATCGRLHPRDAFDVMFPCLRAVAAAHVAGIIHRDLKPANIFLCRATSDSPASVKVLDFGISKLIANSPTVDPMRTKTGAIMGTPHYMAPEQMRGQRVDQRVDIYALGVTLYEVLSGQRPFDANSYPELVLKIVGDPVTPLDHLVPGLPKGLSNVVARAMARDCADRFPNVHALLSALAPFRIHPTSAPFMEHTRAPQPTVTRPLPRTPLFSESIAEGKTLNTHSSSSWPWWSAAAAAVALAAAGLVWDRQNEERHVEESMSAATSAHGAELGANNLARERPTIEVGPTADEPPPQTQSFIGTPVTEPNAPAIIAEVAETPPLSTPIAPASDAPAAPPLAAKPIAVPPSSPTTLAVPAHAPVIASAPLASAPAASAPSAPSTNAAAVATATALGTPTANPAAVANAAHTPTSNAAVASATGFMPPQPTAATPAHLQPSAASTHAGASDREQTPQQMLDELRKLAPQDTAPRSSRPRMDTSEF